MSKTEEAKGLLAVAQDAARNGRERLKALLAANDIRSGLKVGWAKLTPDGQPLNYAALLADVQEATEEGAPRAPDGPGYGSEAEGPDDRRAPLTDADFEEAAAKTAAVPVKPRAKAAKAAKKPKDEARGQISALVRRLLLEGDLPYEEIVEAVRKAHPTAKTTARSVASVASDLRSAGKKVAMRRPEAAAT